MKIQIARLAGLALTLGTAMSAVAIQSDRDQKFADTAATVATEQQGAAARQVTPAASKILILPRPL